MDIEKMAMKLIVESGNAKSKMLEAIAVAKSGDIVRAREIFRLSEQPLTTAHEIERDLIQEESDGALGTPTLLLIHAQDHLMGAILIRDIALEFIDLYERLQQEDKK